MTTTTPNGTAPVRSCPDYLVSVRAAKREPWSPAGIAWLIELEGKQVILLKLYVDRPTRWKKSLRFEISVSNLS